MAEKPEKNEEEKNQAAQDQRTHTVAINKSTNKPLIISIVAAVVLALALIAVVIALVATNVHHRMNNTARMNSSSYMQSRDGTKGEAPAKRFMGTGDRADSSTRVSGVVTAVNGDDISVAGNGKTITIKKSSSTTIRGTSTTVSVNDTIFASGTTSDNVFTATTITIRNIQ